MSVQKGILTTSVTVLRCNATGSTHSFPSLTLPHPTTNTTLTIKKKLVVNKYTYTINMLSLIALWIKY